MTVRELYFVRHGESEHHVRGLTGGWTDTPLTSLGTKQVGRTARYLEANLADAAPPAIIASDLVRARQSAEIIAHALNANVVTTPLLREINNGIARNLTLIDAARIRRPEPRSRSVDYRAYEGAETFAELHERAAQALDHIAAFNFETAVVVGHGLAGQCLLRCWLGIDLDIDIALHLDPASCSHVRINAWDEHEIRLLNFRA